MNNNILTLQWQQTQIEEYCSHYHQNTERVHWDRMLYEDKHKVIYCSVPKTGCTTMKTMMVLLQGLFTLDQLNKTKVTVTHASYLGKAFKLCRVNSIRPCYQPKNNTDYLLKNYYKFVVVRDPLERFVSAYHNKFASKDSESVYQNLQKKILQTYRNNNAEFPSFSEFVGYVFHTKLHSSDRHLIPVTGLCGPCQIKYDFYVNFRILKEDVGSLLQLLNIPQDYFFNNIKHKKSLMPKSIHYNSSIVIDHFNQLSPDQRMTFFKEFSNELEFYEAIFPGDLDIYHSVFSEFNHSNYTKWQK